MCTILLTDKNLAHLSKSSGILETFIIWQAKGATYFWSRARISRSFTSECSKKYNASGQEGTSRIFGLILITIRQFFKGRSSQTNAQENVSILCASSITTTVPSVSRHCKYKIVLHKIQWNNKQNTCRCQKKHSQIILMILNK